MRTISLFDYVIFRALILITSNCSSDTDSFPVPTYLFFKGDERLGRNDVKVAGQAGKGERKVGSLPDFRAAFP